MKQFVWSALVVASLGLAACSSSHEPSNVSDTASASLATITGTAASSQPIVGALVSVRDSKNILATATTDDKGNFAVNTIGMTPPFMVALHPLDGSRTLAQRGR